MRENAKNALQNSNIGVLKDLNFPAGVKCPIIHVTEIECTRASVRRSLSATGFASKRTNLSPFTKDYRGAYHVK